MDARLDIPFESWGGFSETLQGSPVIHGRLHFDPKEGIELDLVENPRGQGPGAVEPPELDTLYGRLVDGTCVTLSGCFVRKGSVQIGIGIGSPTIVVVNRALFGRHTPDLDQLRTKACSTEYSSVTNWTCTSPLSHNFNTSEGKFLGLDASYRPPPSIHVALPDAAFDLKISQSMNTHHDACAFTIRWHAHVSIDAHDSLSLEDINKIAWQCQNLMSLLVGEQLSVRCVSITPADESSGELQPPLRLVYHQRGMHDRENLHVPEMLLPYGLIKGEFVGMVRRWFARSEQATLATDVFFGSQYFKSPAVNVKFLAVIQAAESYHRSLGTGVYMQEDEYAATISEFLSHLPAAIQGDHRQSLKNRLKYGNEHSLRKRLTDLLGRLPENARLRIAGDLGKFVSKTVDTRNYYTHYDHASRANAFEGKDAFVAAERIRILVVANLLHDLGIKGDALLVILERSRDFQHWMSQQLPL